MAPEDTVQDPDAVETAPDTSDDDRREAAAIVLPEYERQISEAQARADDDLIADLQERYHDERLDTLNRRRERAAERERAEQDRGEGDGE